MKKFLRSFWIVLVLLSAAMVHFACQLPTEPTNVTTNSPTIVVVEDQGNNPVKDLALSVQWKILYHTDSSWHTMSPANTPIHDGTFSDIIPIPVGDDTTFVVFEINSPQGYTPAIQLDTEKGYCGSQTFTFHITQTPITVANCSPVALSVTHVLTANEPSKSRDTARTAVYINNLGTLTFSYSAVPVLPTPPSLPNIVLEFSINGGGWNSLPVYPLTITIPAGAQYQFRYRLMTDSLTTQNSSQQYLVTIIGKDPSGDTCVNLAHTIDVHIKVQTPCDCPTGTFRYFDTASTCVGSTVADTIEPKVSNSNTKCSIVLSRLASSKLDNDISISPELDGAVIVPGSSVPKVVVSFDPQSVKTYDIEYDYSVALRSASGAVTSCDSVLRLFFHGTVGTPACKIDLNSPLLQNDTLLQVINSDSESGKTLCVKNTGGCSLSITSAALVSGRIHPFHITTSLPVSIPPNSEGCVNVSFTPTDADVWPNGRAGQTPVDIFHDSLRITTSAGCDTTVPVVGTIKLPNYNNPCLEVWGQSKFYGGIVLGDSGTYSNTLNTTTSDNFSIYATAVNGPAGTATLASGAFGGVTFIKIPPNKPSLAPQNICDISPQYSDQCGTAGGTTSITVSQGDVILFEFTDPKTFQQECGVMWISEFSQTAGPGTPYSVCFQLCFPI